MYLLACHRLLKEEIRCLLRGDNCCQLPKRHKVSRLHKVKVAVAKTEKLVVHVCTNTQDIYHTLAIYLPARTMTTSSCPHINAARLSTKRLTNLKHIQGPNVDLLITTIMSTKQ